MSYLDEFFERRKQLRAKSEGRTPEQVKKAEEQLLEDQRQKFISYKKFFGDDHGKEVMLDLMNRFYMATPETESAIALARAAGRRDVVEYLLGRANMDMNRLDKILKGEFI